MSVLGSLLSSSLCLFPLSLSLSRNLSFLLPLLVLLVVAVYLFPVTFRSNLCLAVCDYYEFSLLFLFSFLSF
ncbi:hypothetical protein P167DRAFT_539233 [Morchella conica CCBAS932]|uniref:Uncharacterized protein n=1 Tax=Morchella conica CCBAS932 TaxID=1392247 RepID=A0A3N4KD32_9PEZI|nr:hypothetical protein P167DRAFT_539233 [Morchella conica CCBAS932]